MNMFNVEEMNLLAIYRKDTAADTVSEMKSILPLVDEDIRQIARRVMEKLNTMTEEAFSELEVYAEDAE